MLSPQLRKKVDTLWTLFWAAGMTNPLVAVEQTTYLLFIRQLEGLDRERARTGKPTIYGKGLWRVICPLNMVRQAHAMCPK